jgi:hypothetical protein
MPNWTPSFWEYVGVLFGDKELGQKLFWYFQYIALGLVAVGIVVSAFFMLYLWVRLAGGANDEEKKKLMMRRNNIGHGFVYLLAGFLAVQVFWNVMLPPILTWFMGK